MTENGRKQGKKGRTGMQRPWVRAVTTLMTAAMMILIFAFSTEPAEQSDATSGTISGLAADLFRPGWRELPPEEKKEYYDGIQLIVRKCAHFTEFALLGLSLRLCLESWAGRRKGLTAAGWGGGTLYAALDELHQLSVSGRSGQWTDVLIDSAGVLAGAAAAAGIIGIICKTGRKRT